MQSSSLLDVGFRDVGAVAEPSALNCTELTCDRPTVLVVGGEGKGLRTTVKRACTDLVRVDGLSSEARDRGLDSLNVSVAAGILLHRLLTSKSSVSR